MSPAAGSDFAHSQPAFSTGEKAPAAKGAVLAIFLRPIGAFGAKLPPLLVDALPE
jgi:hypothetical protein